MLLNKARQTPLICALLGGVWILGGVCGSLTFLFYLSEFVSPEYILYFVQYSRWNFAGAINFCSFLMSSIFKLVLFWLLYCTSIWKFFLSQDLQMAAFPLDSRTYSLSFKRFCQFYFCFVYSAGQSGFLCKFLIHLCS